MLDVADVSGSLGKITDKKSEYEVLGKEIDSILNQIVQISAVLKMKKNDLINLNRRKEDHSKAMSVHSRSFRFDPYNKEENVTAAYNKAEENRRKLEKYEIKCKGINACLDNVIKNREKYMKAIDEFKYELTKFQAEISTLSGQISILKIADFESSHPEELIKQKDDCLKNFNELEEKFKTESELIISMRKNLDTINGEIKANSASLDGLRKDLAESQSRLEKRMAVSVWNSVDEIEKILIKKIDTEKGRKQISDYRQEVAIAGESLHQIEKETSGRKFDEKLYNEITNKKSELEGEIDKNVQDLGRFEGELIKLERNIIDLKKLKKEYSELLLKSDDLKTLKGMFKGSGFVNYISTVYLQELCHAANERFYKLTRQRLRLEVTPENNFQVRDFMNGGKTRSVKTLSGGQTFQAALSLALALAGNIQKLTGSEENFFFLDEGFGSLDKESLDIVFDALKSLRKENRIVGIISHVEDMQQEIDSHLKVINDPEKGSLIKAGWN
jgi:exonuclease SbcC